MKLPNFLIIGATKSATTSLYHYLKQHPQIFMPSLDEVNLAFFIFGQTDKPNFTDYRDNFFFDQFMVKNMEAYYQLFEDCDDSKIAIGEKSNGYLYSEKAPQLIHKNLPDVKLIAILRNPVERAYSHYTYWCSRGFETLSSFEEALHAEKERMQQKMLPTWYYKDMGFYYKQLQRYFDIFDHNQIRVYLYDDFQANPLLVLSDIFAFLGVNSSFLPKISQKRNVTPPVRIIPKSDLIDKFIYNASLLKTSLKYILPRRVINKISIKIKQQNSLIKEHKPLSKTTKNFLISEYRQDILNLQSLIKRDLSNWLT